MLIAGGPAAGTRESDGAHLFGGMRHCDESAVTQVKVAEHPYLAVDDSCHYNGAPESTEWTVVLTGEPSMTECGRTTTSSQRAMCFD